MVEIQKSTTGQHSRCCGSAGQCLAPILGRGGLRATQGRSGAIRSAARFGRIISKLHAKANLQRKSCQAEQQRLSSRPANHLTPWSVLLTASQPASQPSQAQSSPARPLSLMSVCRPSRQAVCASVSPFPATLGRISDSKTSDLTRHSLHALRA